MVAVAHSIAEMVFDAPYLSAWQRTLRTGYCAVTDFAEPHSCTEGDKGVWRLPPASTWDIATRICLAYVSGQCI